LGPLRAAAKGCIVLQYYYTTVDSGTQMMRMMMMLAVVVVVVLKNGWYRNIIGDLGIGLNLGLGMHEVHQPSRLKEKSQNCTSWLWVFITLDTQPLLKHLF
jgi:hypothetical protein